MIKIENRQVFSTDGRYIHRIGSDIYFKHGTTLKDDTSEMYEEVDEIPTYIKAEPAYTKAEYDAKVAELIREKYSADEEDAIKSKLLNVLLHPEAATLDEMGEASGVTKEVAQFDEFYAYRQQCKEMAKNSELYKRNELMPE